MWSFTVSMSVCQRGFTRMNGDLRHCIVKLIAFPCSSVALVTSYKSLLSPESPLLEESGMPTAGCHVPGQYQKDV